MLRATATVLFGAALLLTSGCSGGSTTAAPTDSSSGAAPASSSASSTDDSGHDSTDDSSSSATAGSADDAVEISVTVRKGKVIPRTRRVKVPEGSTVRLVVTSDVADEVHVHGYDLKKDIEAGQPGVIEFTADQSGVFEVELEHKALQLTQLQVQ